MERASMVGPSGRVLSFGQPNEASRIPLEGNFPPGLSEPVRFKN